jgi:hypothetical protein
MGDLSRKKWSRAPSTTNDEGSILTASATRVNQKRGVVICLRITSTDREECRIPTDRESINEALLADLPDQAFGDRSMPHHSRRDLHLPQAVW